MKPGEVDLWQRANRLFGDLLELSQEERAARLAREDPTLRAKVEAMFAAHDDAEEGLLDQAIDRQLRGLSTAAGGALEGRQLGAWVLAEEIGRGGSSVVHRARRADGETDQQVALKLLTLGSLGHQGDHHVQHERRVLAQLRHPSIATLIDGGLAEDGTPYLVVELVDGRRLDHYCDEEALDVRQRLSLLLAVCDAVAYAHRNLIVHRDLKPGNILVDDDGNVRLLDFGIAKLLEDPEVTRGVRLLTPGYAAPEQLSGSTVTTATDVFGLGVVLYKLLTGQLPPGFERRLHLEGGADRPPAPSTLSTLQGVDRDLDAIVLMAIRAEPERRYADARELADDLRRWLDQRPIAAGPDRVSYRARKFVARHRFVVAAAILAIGGLLGGSSVAVWQASIARQESTRARAAAAEAQSEARRAEEVTTFLIDTFAAADPLATRGDEVTAREIVDAGLERIDRELVDQPQDRQRLLMVLGKVSLQLGDFARSRQLMSRVLDAPALEDKVRLAALKTSAIAASEAGDSDAAEELFATALDLAARSGAGPAERAELELAFSTHLVDTHQYERSEGLMQALLDADWFVAEGSDADRARVALELAAAMQGQGEFAQALPWGELAVRELERLRGSHHPELASALRILAGITTDLGEVERAERLERRALVINQTIYGEAHLQTLVSQNNLATLLKIQGRFDEAARVHREVLAVQEEALGPEHPHVAVSWFNLGEAELLAGDTLAALESYRQAIERGETSLGRDHPRVAIFHAISGRALGKAGRIAEAEAAFRVGLGRLDGSLGDQHPLTARIHVEFAAFLADQSRFGEASSWLADVGPILADAYGLESREHALFLLQRGRALAGSGRGSEAVAPLRGSRDILSAGPHRDRYASEIRQAEELLTEIGTD